MPNLNPNTEALLAGPRAEIDEIDNEIEDLLIAVVKGLAARNGAVAKIKQIKEEHAIPAHQPTRFQTIIDHARDTAIEAGVNPEPIIRFWHGVHEDSLSQQSQEASIQPLASPFVGHGHDD